MNVFDLVAKISLDDSDYKSKLGSAVGFAGKTALGVGKALVAGVTAGATATGILVGNSVKQYAEYEQLVGGVETLFKDNYKSVVENSKKANKAAGLSANQYMNTVTSFSASLLQSLGGNTKKAAAYADKAVRDMSDNSNKMGTSMEAIQNAYQGFAKQNYTMLDNLKLGYGGTKTEMERLIKDAEELDDSFKASRDSNGDLTMSYADIVDAIHIVQDEMGITGTTAKEADETISGSLNTMKSSWQNLVTALSDPNADLSSYISDFVDSAKTFASNLIPVVEEAIEGVGKLVSELLPPIIQEIPTFINEILPDLLDKGSEMLSTIIQGLTDNADEISEGVLDLAETLVDTITDNAPSFFELAFKLVTTFFDNLSEKLPTLIPKLTDSILSILKTIVKNLPDLLDSIVDVVNSLIEGIIESLPTIIEAMPDLIDGILEVILQSIPTILESIVEVSSAITEMLPELITTIFETVPDLLENVVDLVADPDLWGGVISAVLKLILLSFEMPIELIVGLLSSLSDSITEAILGEEGVKIQKIGKALVSKAWEGTIAQMKSDLESDNFFGMVWEKTKWGFENFFLPGWNAAWDKFNNVWDSVKGWFDNTNGSLQEWFSGIGTSISKWFSGVWTSVSDWFSGITNSVPEWISGIWKSVSDWFSSIWDSISDWFSGLGEDFKTWGQNLITGLWNGIVEKWNNFWSDITDLFDGFIGGIKDMLGIASPSKVFAEFGRFSMMGLAKGLTDNSDLPLEAMDKIASEFSDVPLNADMITTSSSSENNSNLLAREIVNHFNFDNVTINSDDDIESFADKLSEALSSNILSAGMAWG